MAAPVADQAWLAWIGRLLEASVGLKGATLPRSEFYCRLDDQPDHLVPTAQVPPELWEGLTDRPLYLNSHGRFTHACEFVWPFENVPVLNLSQLALGGDIFWIEDPGHGAYSPFWLGPILRSFLEDLQPGDEVAAADMPSGSLRVLAMAGVLVTEDYAVRRHEKWARTTGRVSDQFRTRGFAPVCGLVHPFHISALRRYYRWQIRNGKMRLGDRQSPLRYVAHNEPIASFFHHQLTGAVSALVGEPAKPSYAYVGSYQPGALLKEHTDREQCEFSLTLCLDYSPEPTHATPWPIRLHTGAGTVTVFQSPGDSLLYRGREIPHSRERLPDGHTSTSIFFHYVPKDFKGSPD
jgi:hypothetical protein